MLAQHIVNHVIRGILRAVVVEGDDVIIKAQLYALARRVGTVQHDAGGFLRNGGAHQQAGALHHFILQHAFHGAGLVVVHGIPNLILTVLGIQVGILRNGVIEAEPAAARGIGIPVDEGIILLLGNLARAGGVFIVNHRLGGNGFRLIVLGMEGNGAGGQNPVGIQHHTGGHAVVARIAGLMVRVGIPALKGCALRRRRAAVGRAVEIAGDIRVEAHLIGFHLAAVIIVEGQRIGIGTVVEVGRQQRVGRGVAKGIVSCSPSVGIGGRIAVFGIAGNSVEVGIVIQIVKLHIDGFEQTVGNAVAGGGALAFVVFQPVVQHLLFRCGVRKGIHREHIVVVVQNGATSAEAVALAGHGEQLHKLIVVHLVQVPAVIAGIEGCGEGLVDVLAVFGRDFRSALVRRGKAAVGLVQLTVPPQGIPVAVVPHGYHAGTVRLDQGGVAVQEFEIGGIQAFRLPLVGLIGGDRHRGIHHGRLRDAAQVGIAIVIRVFNHIDDGVFHGAGLPLGINGGILRHLLGGDGAAAEIGRFIPAHKVIAEIVEIIGCREGMGAFIQHFHRVHIGAAAGVEGQSIRVAGILDLHNLILLFQNDVLMLLVCIMGNLLDLGLRPAADGGTPIHAFDFRIAIPSQILDLIAYKIARIGKYVFYPQMAVPAVLIIGRRVQRRPAARGIPANLAVLHGNIHRLLGGKQDIHRLAIVLDTLIGVGQGEALHAASLLQQVAFHRFALFCYGNLLYGNLVNVLDIVMLDIDMVNARFYPLGIEDVVILCADYVVRVHRLAGAFTGGIPAVKVVAAALRGDGRNGVAQRRTLFHAGMLKGDILHGVRHEVHAGVQIAHGILHQLGGKKLGGYDGAHFVVGHNSGIPLIMPVLIFRQGGHGNFAGIAGHLSLNLHAVFVIRRLFPGEGNGVERILNHAGNEPQVLRLAVDQTHHGGRLGGAVHLDGNAAVDILIVVQQIIGAVGIAPLFRGNHDARVVGGQIADLDAIAGAGIAVHQRRIPVHRDGFLNQIPAVHLNGHRNLIHHRGVHRRLGIDHGIFRNGVIVVRMIAKLPGIALLQGREIGRGQRPSRRNDFTGVGQHGAVFIREHHNEGLHSPHIVGIAIRPAVIAAQVGCQGRGRQQLQHHGHNHQQGYNSFFQQHFPHLRLLSELETIYILGSVPD